MNEKKKHIVDYYLEMDREQFFKLPWKEKTLALELIQNNASRQVAASVAKGLIPGVEGLEKKAIERGVLPQTKIGPGWAHTGLEMVGAIAPIGGVGKVVATPIIKGLGHIKALKPLARMLGWGTAGSTYEGVKKMANEGELPTIEEAGKNFATWGALEGGLQAIGALGKFSKAIIQRANKKGVTRNDAFKEVLSQGKENNLRMDQMGDQKNQKVVAAKLIEIAEGKERYLEGNRERVIFGPQKEKVPFKEKASNFYTHYIDDLHPLKKLEESLYGKKVDLPLQESFYKQARMTRGWSGQAQNILSHETHRGNPGLLKILEPMGKKQKDFSVYLANKHAIDLEVKGIRTGFNLKEAKRFVAKNQKQFAKGEESLRQYNHDMLDYAVEKGLISNQTKTLLKEKHLNYVPFQRLIEASEKTGFGSRNLRVKNVIKAIRGSERKVIDPIQSISENTYRLVEAGEKNQALNTMINAIEKNGHLKEFLTLEPMGKGVNKNVLAALDTKSFVAGKDEFVLFRGGKRKIYKAPKEVAEAINGLNSQEVNTLTKILSYPARWTRVTATGANPTFGIKALTRDQFEAWMYSKYGYVPGVDFAKGLFHSIKRTPLYHEWVKAGGKQSMMRRVGREERKTSIKKLGREGKVFKNIFRNPLEALENMGLHVEEATRLGEFAKGLKKGASPQEAALQSRELTLDFSRRGSKTQTLNMIIPFFNAAIQGADKFARAMKANPIKMTAKGIASITLPSLGLWAYNQKYHKKEYARLPDWEKLGYWNFWAGGKHFKIAKPWEIGDTFANIPETIMEYAQEKDPRVVKELLKQLGHTFSPPFVPAFAQPFLDIARNKKFTGAPIVPKHKEKMQPEDQYGKHTSETAKKIGQWTGKSPAKLEHLSTAWTGDFGRAGLKVLDWGLAEMGVVNQKPPIEKEWGEYPILKGFIGKSSSQTKPITLFYEEIKKQNELKSSILEAQKQGNRFRIKELYREYNPEWHKTLQREQRQFTKIRKYIDSLQESKNLTPHQKKEKSDKLQEQMINRAEKILEYRRKSRRKVA